MTMADGPGFARQALEALFRNPPAADENKVRQLCLCELEYCYCLETADVDVRDARPEEWACAECQAGRHVDMNGQRDR